MSEEKTLAKNEFLFEGEVVKVQHFGKSEDDKHLFYYKETTSPIIETINPKLYKKLYLAVSKFVTKYDQIQKERKEARDKLEIEEKLNELEGFIQMFKKTAPKELIDRDPKFRNSQNLDRWSSVGVVEFYSKTSRKSIVKLSLEEGRWMVEDSSYKKRRYKTIEKASARVIEVLDDYESTEKATNTRDQAIKAFTADTGLLLTKGWHFPKYGYGKGKGHATYELRLQGSKEYSSPITLKMLVSYKNECSIYAVEIKEPITILDRVCQNITFNLKETITDPEAVKKLASDITKAIKSTK